MRDVDIDSIPLDRLAPLLGPTRAARLPEYAQRARVLLRGRTVWNVNATATGGGVAEMLQALLAYTRGAQIDTRWLVLDGTPEFFQLTKRIHNHLHGSAGDAGSLDDEERKVFDRVLADNLANLRKLIRAGDIVILHDPQTAGLVTGLLDTGAHVVWRCHVGRDTPNELSDGAWSFLRPYVEPAEAVIFSRQVYAPGWVDPSRLWVIPPSLDPFSTKNRDLSAAEVRAALRQAGIVRIPEDHGSLAFVRRDGSPGTVRRHTDLMLSGEPVPDGARIVLQVSRWDRLKDMAGVLSGFVGHLSRLPEDVHLMLVGPDVSGVSDDPEGAEVLQECLAIWREQPSEARQRLHLCSLPMDDIDENAHLVNAPQRRAAIVVQKSLVEGFGLTVTEPMWKGRPVVASRVGGIQDQIIDGESGLLLDDPADLASFGTTLINLLGDDELAERLGAAARERVRDLFLGDRHLIQYVELFESLLADTV
jgi:trehalose synthase